MQYPLPSVEEGWIPMNAKLSRISTIGVMASAGTVLCGALVVMLSGSLAFADGAPPAPQIARDPALPIDAPVLRREPPKAPGAPKSTAPIDEPPPPIFFGKDIENTGSIVYV